MILMHKAHADVFVKRFVVSYSELSSPHEQEGYEKGGNGT